MQPVTWNGTAMGLTMVDWKVSIELSQADEYLYTHADEGLCTSLASGMVYSG